MLVHLDTDFLVFALSRAGVERRTLLALVDRGDEVQMSAVAWYEFSRGPRTAEQLAVGRSFFAEQGIVPFGEALAGRAAEIFRLLGSPRKRAADVAIGVTAAAAAATLFTRHARDFRGIPDVEVKGTQD